MFKKIIAVLAMLFSISAFAAVEVNQATAAELDGVKGIGPAMSARIIKERKKGPFKDWADLQKRVSGIGEKSAANLSEAGLTVNGMPYAGTTKTPSTTSPTTASKKAEPQGVAGKGTQAQTTAANPAASAAKK